ncbi:MAG: LuxR C-terminal-related transcriptional regulator [Anaerolineae bacterium]
MMGLNLSPAAVAVLETRTEGWVAGLQMAALSMQGRSDITSFINQFTGSHRYIIDYLMDEVLRQQPDDLQQFLLQTSILTRLSGPLCDAVLGKAEGGGRKDEGKSIFFIFPPSSLILERLEQANLFVIPLDHERRWYRYHHLFAETLQHRLENLYPEQIPVLHRRASKWYEQHGLLAEAIQHALSVPDFERAADMVEQIGQELLMRSEMATLLKWLNILPEDVIQTRPNLCLFHAWTLILNGQITQAEQRLQEASTQAMDTAILGQAAAMRAFVTLLQGNIQLADELTRKALELLPAGDPFLRGLTALTQGIPYFLNGDVETALQIFVGVADISQQSGNIMLTILILCQIAEAQIGQGQLHRARATYQRALDLATMPDGQQLPGASQAHIGLAAIWYEWNDLAAAIQHIAEGLHLGQQVGEMGAFDAYILQINLKQTQGDTAGALKALEQAAQLIQKFSPFMHRLLTIYRVRLWLRQGNLADAAREAFLEELSTAADMEHTYHFYELKQLTLIRVLIAQAAASAPLPSENPAQKAHQILETLYPEAVKLGRGRSLIEIWLLRALAYRATGNLTQALDSLAQALSLAEAEGFIRLFVDEGAPVAELLKRMNPLPGAGDEGGTPSVKEYIHKLLLAFEVNKSKRMADESVIKVETSSLHPSSLSLHPLVDPLSERELEILRLIAAGYSNEEIAETLIIALGTVKKHIHNIYDKLGVHSRTQALIQARVFKLLP